jgi:uncharacterized protein
MPSDALPRLVIAGAGGTIGTHLMRAAQGRFQPVVLTRGGAGAPGGEVVRWNPHAAAASDAAGLAVVTGALEGAAAVVNLAGSSISAGRLDARHVAALRASRVDAGATLSEAAARCRRPPAVFFQISGTNIYGDGGERELDEETPIDVTTPLGEVGVVWEASARPPSSTRAVVGRAGMVLAPDAEVWRRLLLPVRLFVGGPFGSGEQWWPWIHADDLARAILWLVERDDAEGVYNLVGEPVRQIDLIRGVARRLGRPALLRAPAVALRAVLGGLADALLLESRRVVPARLYAEGFEFEAPAIDTALDRLLAVDARAVEHDLVR